MIIFAQNPVLLVLCASLLTAKKLKFYVQIMNAPIDSLQFESEQNFKCKIKKKIAKKNEMKRKDNDRKKHKTVLYRKIKKKYAGEFMSLENAKLVDGNFIKVNAAIFC